MLVHDQTLENAREESLTKATLLYISHMVLKIMMIEFRINPAKRRKNNVKSNSN